MHRGSFGRSLTAVVTALAFLAALLAWREHDDVCVALFGEAAFEQQRDFMDDDVVAAPAAHAAGGRVSRGAAGHLAFFDRRAAGQPEPATARCLARTGR